MSPRLAAELGLGVALLIAFLGVYYFHGEYVKQKEAFASFKGSVETAGKAADKVKTERETFWRNQLSQQEKRHAQVLEGHRTRFDRELERLLAQSNGGSSGLSGDPETVSICIDGASNQRLSAALRTFEVGVVRLLKECQVQTDALVACQDYAKTVTTFTGTTPKKGD